jgi:biopolymer transport protein ExbD
MRRPPNNDQRERVSSPDITPLVDVVFLLIIFFLTTSTMVRQTTTQLDLPEQPGNAEANNRDRGLVVNIDRQGRLIVDGAPAPLQRVLAMIDTELNPDDPADKRTRPRDEPELLIRADEQAPTASLNDLARGLTDIGLTSWRIATRAPRNATPTPNDTAG